MWHVETDFFALAVFLIMFIKEYGMRRVRKHGQSKGMMERDIQSDSFYFVLVLSIISVLIDIASSLVMNGGMNWWVYEIFMTIYVASMPLLAVVWVGYAYVLIHKDYSLKRLLKGISFMTVPYALYVVLAFSNPFTGWFFTLSKTMQYERGILFMPVGVGMIMLYSAIGLLLVLFYWRKIMPYYNAVLLIAFFAITAAFTWAQLAHPGWLIINASYAVIYIWCDIAIEDERRDNLYREIAKKNVELKVIAQKAESAAEAKSEFLSRMSHDIRTPMNAIIGLNHLAQGEDDIEVIRGYLNKMDSSSKFLLGLINDILDLSKIENGEMTLHEGPFTCEEFKNSIQTVIKPLIDEKDINFVFKMDSGLECINVDRLRFSQIFFNLLSNAVKFTPTGGTIEFISERIDPTEDVDGGKVGLRMYVRDNGIGMSEEFLHHMYDPFMQEKSELGDKVRGTGLGLPIVKSLVEVMGGTIEVKSTLGKGTEFKIELYVETADVPEQEKQQQYDMKALQDAHILLVDDNDLNVYVAKTILEQFACIVYVANNGQEAVAKFAASSEDFYDVILMDVQMPVMNGLSATRAIRAMDRRDAAAVPIIAMTADAFDKEKNEILESGMNCHLPKPIDPPLLYQTILEYRSKRLYTGTAD
ncbi:MAG: ATP-binding protein [Lachnospiraceae bacterium]|nr:ATP-binding protein [Lachnospiraceae bacterium]